MSVYDVVIIASMIEREIEVPEERELAASVIYNRLDAGNPLGIDATIRFEDQNWTEPLVESRLNEATPYNTRINAGLPPGPIGNPGLRLARGGREPGRDRLLLLRGQAGHLQRAHLRRDGGGVRRRGGRVPGGLGGGGRLADGLLSQR